MVVPVEISVICFLIGNGLFALGAFFVWRLVGCRQKPWATVGAILPVGSVIAMTCITGRVELVGGIIWGTVAFNLGLMGVLGLLFNVYLVRNKILMATLWLALGWLTCLFERQSGTIGHFGGLGLIICGLIAVWCGGKSKSTLEKSNSQSTISGWRWWCLGLGAVLLVLVGAWLLLCQTDAVAVIMGIPISLINVLILAPLCTTTALLGLRQKGQWQPFKVLDALSGSNVGLATMGLGLTAVVSGTLYITQTMLTVTLPWVAVLAVLSIIVTSLPTKTARWWGGLMVIVDLAWLFSLFV